MAGFAANVTEAELAVLEFLWESGPATKRQICEQLYPEQTDSDFSTVQKLLERLERKRVLIRDRSQFAHQFESSCSREEFIGQQVEAMVDKMSGGSLLPVLMHLVGNDKLTRQERDRIRQMLDEAERKS